MAFKFKVGDKVRHASYEKSGLIMPFGFPNGVITVDGVAQDILYFKQYHGGWYSDRFQPVQIYRKPEEAQKDDSDKSRLDILLGCRGIDQVGHVFAYGAKKYEQYNWRKSGNDDSYKRRLVGAALRHLFAYLTGNRTDPETGKSHIAHAIADLAMVIDLEKS